MSETATQAAAVPGPESELALRARNRAIAAAEDAVDVIGHGDIGAARLLLAEAGRHLDRLEKVRARDGGQQR